MLCLQFDLHNQQRRDMATARRSITGALKAAAQGGTPANDQPQATESEAPAPGGRSSYRAGTREGKKPISAPVDPAAKMMLKILSAEQQMTQEDLIREAIRDLFTKYGKPAVV
jgi:hypothetical protein